MPHRTRLFLQTYARDSINILESSLEMIRKGNPAFYKVVAVELRTLLCDTTLRYNKVMDISLASRLAMHLILYPLGPDGSFDISQPCLPLAEWLQQPLTTGLEPPITIRDLIHKACEQRDSAHVAPKPNTGLTDTLDAAAWITAIGNCVAPELKAALLPENA